MAPVPPAPALAQTTMGWKPEARSSATARRSASMSSRKSSSLGIVRVHSGLTPMTMAARLTATCV